MTQRLFLNILLNQQVTNLHENGEKKMNWFVEQLQCLDLV